MKEFWIDNTVNRYILFSLICLAYVSNGFNVSVISPSIDDLANIYDVKSETISYGFTIKSISNCIFSLLASITMTYGSRHLQFIMALAFYGLATILTPILPNVTYYWFCWIIFGGASAYIDIAVNVWVLELFELQNMNLHVQCMHLCFAIGLIIGPISVQNYLAPNSAAGIVISESHIHIPFLFAGICFWLVAAALLICYIIQPYITPDRKVFGPKVKDMQVTSQSTGKEQTLQKTTNYPLSFRIIFMVLMQLSFTLELVSEYNLMQYIPQYLTKSSLAVPSRQSAFLMTMFSAAQTVGRGICILLAAFAPRVSVAVMFYVQMSLTIISCFMLRFICQADLAPDASGEYFWTNIALWLLGLGFSSAFPNIMVFLEERINITNKLNCIMLAISTVGVSTSSVILAKLLETTPNLVLLVVASLLVALIISFALMHSTDIFRKRFKKMEIFTSESISQQQTESLPLPFQKYNVEKQ